MNKKTGQALWTSSKIQNLNIKFCTNFVQILNNA